MRASALEADSVTIQTQENCVVTTAAGDDASVTVTIKANDGYEFGKLNVNGVTLNPTTITDDRTEATYVIRDGESATVEAWCDPDNRLDLQEATEYMRALAESGIRAQSMPAGFFDNDVTVTYDYTSYPGCAVFDAGFLKKYKVTDVITYARQSHPGRAHLKIFGTDTMDPGLFTTADGANAGNLTALTHGNDAFFGTGSWNDNKGQNWLTDSPRGAYQVDENPGFRYIVIASDHQSMLSLTELKLCGTVLTTASVGDVLDVEDVKYAQGSRGTNPEENRYDFGVVQNATDDTMGLLGMRDGDPVNFPRINAIDAIGAGWIGNVQTDVYAAEAGRYRVSILGSSSSQRSYKVTVGDSVYTTNQNGINGAGTVASKHTGSEYVYYYFCDVDLKEGVNHITITGNDAAPNFMRMAVTDIPAAKTYRVTVKEEGQDGDGTVLEVEQGKMVACHSDHEVAWTIGDEVLAIGKKFTYIPTGDVTIVAKEVAPEMKAQGIVTDGKVAEQKFTVTFGESVTGNVTYTFVTSDKKAAEVTVPVNEFAGNTVEYTITGAEDKDIQYVIARKEKAE